MIPYEDLIGRSHEPIRCIGYCLLVLERVFDDFMSNEIPTTPEAARAWLESPPASRWREIGRSSFAATKAGDLLYGEDKSDVGAYVAVLVDPRGGGCITSDPKRGCHVRMRDKLVGVKSVQRRE